MQSLTSSLPSSHTPRQPSSSIPFFTPSTTSLCLYRSRSANVWRPRLALIPPARASLRLDSPRPDCRIYWSNQSHPSPQLSAQQTRPLRRTHHLPFCPLLTRTPGSFFSWTATHRHLYLRNNPSINLKASVGRADTGRGGLSENLPLHGRLPCDFALSCSLRPLTATAFAYTLAVFTPHNTRTAPKTFDIANSSRVANPDTSGGQYLSFLAS